MAGSKSFIFIFLAVKRSSTRLACNLTMRLMSALFRGLKTVNSSILLMNSGRKCERTCVTHQPSTGWTDRQHLVC